MVRSPPGSADLCVFLRHWCSVVVRIVHDYGSNIAYFPWEIYILDMREIFVSNGLGKLYDNYGNLETREPTILFSDDHRKPSPAVHNHLQTAPSGREHLLIQDHIRKVFFAAAYDLRRRETLHVQDVETGRRLPAVVESGEHYGSVHSYAISTDGEYLCICYDLVWSSKNRISIWRLDSKIEVKKILQAEPWACRVIREEPSWGKWKGFTVVYRDDGYFYSSIGRIQPATGMVLPFPPEIFSDLDTSDQYKTHTICIGAQGEVFVHTNLNEVLKVYSSEEPFVVENHSPIATKIRMIRASPKGRYLLLESSFDESLENSSRWSVYHLYNSRTNKVFFEIYRGFFSKACFRIFKG